MEQTNIQLPAQKIYKDRAIWAGTFLGGPLVAGYLMAENFKVFNEPDKAKKAWIYAIIATVVIFGGIFLIPDIDKIPRQFIPFVYTIIAYYLVIHYQGPNIEKHINGGGQTYNWWRAAGIGLIGIVITIVPIFGIAYFTDTATNTETVKTYGVMNNNVGFDKKNIPEREVDQIANSFTTTGFFDHAVTKYVYVKKSNSNYEISISCGKSVENNTQAIAMFVQLRNDMQKLFPNNKIIFNLVVDHLDNVLKRIE
jgi:hypothetical protein